MTIWNRVEKIEGWLSQDEAEQLYTYAQDANVIVELGSWKGKSTICLAKGTKGTVYAVDTFKGSPEHKDGTDTLEEFADNLMANGVEVVVLQMTTEEAAKEVDFDIDLLFVDAAHEYDAVKKDFELWAPKVKVGGIIIIHDVFWSNGDETRSHWPGVLQLYREVLESGQYKQIDKADRQAVLEKLYD